MPMNNDNLLALREEAEIHHIDFSRASISRTNDGRFRVVFDNPRFDCKTFLPTPPQTVEVGTAYAAEIAMLRGLIHLERAERRTARMGVVGWAGADICHRPLSDEEVAYHRGRTEHGAKVAELRAELAKALERQTALAQADVGVAELNERYGLKESQPVPTGKRPGRPRKHAVEAQQ